MLDGSFSGRLRDSEIHGFHTLQDLDVSSTFDEARSRWLRPNEIHAILSNSKYFTINVKPVNLPKSGAIVMFDRKMLRNFRKDGHNWKKKKDGKTVKEAHEHLKVGNEERIHVYYAHGQDNPTFVRRCYWLLDKALEHIVLVHYRETQEIQDSPATPVNSNSSSVSDHSNLWLASDELDSCTGKTQFNREKELESVECMTIMNHQMRLHEINTLEWDELVANDQNNSLELKAASFRQSNQSNQLSSNESNRNLMLNRPIDDLSISLNDRSERNDNNYLNLSNRNRPSGLQLNARMEKKPSGSQNAVDSFDFFSNEGLQNEDNFPRWANYSVTDSPSLSDGVVEDSPPSCHGSFTSLETHQFFAAEPIFVISDVSPSWAVSTETTKVLITGKFLEQYRSSSQPTLYCICGDNCLPLDIIQDGVYRCTVFPHSPGLVNFYLSFDRSKPVSKVWNFEYRNVLFQDPVTTLDDKSHWEELNVQIRLVKLLFSTSKSLSAHSGAMSSNNIKQAKKFFQKSSHYAINWSQFIADSGQGNVSVEQAKHNLFDFMLKNLLKDWLFEKVLEGRKTTEFDSQGQGVIHLCAILGYTWVVQLFKLSKLSLDFRDKRGWTALHWASYTGREKMVAMLLSFGANPNRVTDPTPENPAGCTASDLAYSKGYDGLAAYLSEKALVAHFEEMSIAGNVTGSLDTPEVEIDKSKTQTEDDICLKDSLTAYRTAAGAAARIQSAFREHSLKVRTTAVQGSNPEKEARDIIAAMKIQHAFRNYERQRKIVAAARIQHRFRTWKMRKEFLNMRAQAVKIQAWFRGFQTRRQYRKIIWSVGVLEKAILRWRLKRKGFRGLRVAPEDSMAIIKQESDTEEDFYKISRKQAEERVERSVGRVQSMFRSKKAQLEYQTMKNAYNDAKMEYNEFSDPDSDDERELMIAG